MTLRARILRVDCDFQKELNSIKLERIKRNVDNSLKSDRRLTKAIIRSPVWKDLRELLINSELLDDRRK